ncbi:hypothetical protein [Paludibaculum fermentans]|uniref:hypothetical protein n=1 Tax=Paludibaculum fermentans TaxID=1473598 RepID=UPI003EB887BB
MYDAVTQEGFEIRDSGGATLGRDLKVAPDSDTKIYLLAGACFNGNCSKTTDNCRLRFSIDGSPEVIDYPVTITRTAR